MWRPIILYQTQKLQADFEHEIKSNYVEFVTYKLFIIQVNYRVWIEFVE